MVVSRFRCRPRCLVTLGAELSSSLAHLRAAFLVGIVFRTLRGSSLREDSTREIPRASLSNPLLAPARFVYPEYDMVDQLLVELSDAAGFILA